MKKVPHIYLWFFLIITIFTLSGCYFSYPEYPNNWAKQAHVDNDIDTLLEGLYACRGETENGSTNIPNIAYLLFDNNKDQKYIDCNIVSIVRKDSGKFEIIANRHGSVIVSRIIEVNKDYSIEDNWIHLKSKYGDMSDANFIGITNEKNSLTSNEQRELIVKSKFSGAGIAYFIPFGGGQHIWMKFKRIDSATSERLIAALYDNNTAVREQAVIALRYREDPRAVVPLINLLKDENKTLRTEAIWTLGEIGDLRAVEPLIPFLNDESTLVRIRAEHALEHITGQQYKYDASKWQEWLEHNKDNIK